MRLDKGGFENWFVDIVGGGSVDRVDLDSLLSSGYIPLVRMD